MLKQILPPTAKRVSLNTKKEINEKIHQKMLHDIEHYKTKTREEILARIDELDSEWDIERVLETNSSTIIFISAIMSLFICSIVWPIIIATISGFLLQHALQGWCPPLPIFRRMGFRTATEIEDEKCALRRYL